MIVNLLRVLSHLKTCPEALHSLCRTGKYFIYDDRYVRAAKPIDPSSEWLSAGGRYSFCVLQRKWVISAWHRAAPRMLSTSRFAMIHGNAIANPKGASRRASCITHMILDKINFNSKWLTWTYDEDIMILVKYEAPILGEWIKRLASSWIRFINYNG